MKSFRVQSKFGSGPALKRIAAALVGLSLYPLAQAGVDVSSSPLLTATGVPPNIFFLLDDSGSMQWERMPGDIMRNNYSGGFGSNHGYLFPLPFQNGSSGGTYNSASSPDYGDFIPDFNDGTEDNVRYRSSQINATFYDPAVEYIPWRSYDGTGSVPFYVGLGGGDVDPTNAPYNPARTAQAGFIDLTSLQSLRARWYGADSCSDESGSHRSCSFYPITFYQYVGTATERSDLLSAPVSDFVRYQIRGSQGYEKKLSSGVETEVATFPWGRTVEEERQNFANWFSYYRSRTLAARGGASVAFDDLGEDPRVGFATINELDISKMVLTPTSGGFAGAARQNWFATLLGSDVPRNGTPLRSALIWAGEYYAGNKSTGTGSYNPWLPSGEAECRQSFTILTTDGYWSNESGISVPSKDDTDGALYTNDLGGDPYHYVAEPPYSDSHATLTLADIATYYWKTDLQPAIPNKVGSDTDPAYWQHMNTYTLSFGVEGTLDRSVEPTSWPDPTTDPTKIDDLWHAAFNSRGKFVSAKNPEEFKKGLQDALADIGKKAASAASLSGNTTAVSTESFIYQAKYIGDLWTGDLVAFKIGEDAQIVPIDVSDTNPLGYAWSAAQQMPAHGSRKIYTNISGTGYEFKDSVSAVTSAIAPPAGFSAADVINYLRGDTTLDKKDGFRDRGGNVLGDIVNSSPAYVAGPPARPYSGSAVPGASAFKTHRSDYKDRYPVVYVGANDGMLHAFDAETGTELFAYIPSTLLPRLAKLADDDYEHEFFVDGSVVVEDVWDGSDWRSILIVALGRGGKTVVALDVTDAVAADGTVNFDGSGSYVLWELSDSDLGNVLGVPIVTAMNNGKWAVILGNGYNGSSDKAYLYVVDAVTGSVIKKIATNGDTSNGLSGAGGFDDDGNGTVDFLYAGDILGNLWRFDVSGGSPSSDWATSPSGTPMFTATYPTGAASTQPQPITATPMVGANPTTGERWVFFGTGKFIADSDRSDKDVQSWYGLRDAKDTITGRDELVERVITVQGVRDDSKIEYRIVSDVGDAVGGDALDVTDATPDYGWYIDLVLNGDSAKAAGERMLVRNTLLTGVLLGETLTPNNTACSNLGEGWVYAINPWTGGRVQHDFFDTNLDGAVTAGDSVGDKTVGAIHFGNGGIPYLQQCGEGLCMNSGPSDGDLAAQGAIGKTGNVKGRLNWRELLRD